MRLKSAADGDYPGRINGNVNLRTNGLRRAVGKPPVFVTDTHINKPAAPDVFRLFDASGENERMIRRLILF